MGGDLASGNRSVSSLFGIRTEDADGKQFSLYHAPSQKVLKVVQVRGDVHLCALIAEMGIYPGSTLKQRKVGSSCLVRVNKKRHILSLDRKISEKIIVR
ncbi:MAG: ferrous iron transport protein A [Desulfobacteraceae bacterium]|nr:ferrous iron transport protein A [Desulfobacteraceae bacterium]